MIVFGRYTNLDIEAVMIGIVKVVEKAIQTKHKERVKKWLHFS